jgi:hypothetical protein
MDRMDRRKSLIPLCRHTKTDGRLCGSPALTGRSFCYYHQRYHHLRKPGGRPTRPVSLDTAAIQGQVSAVMSGVVTGRFTPSQAGAMLFALQLATENLKAAQRESIICPQPPSPS